MRKAFLTLMLASASPALAGDQSPFSFPVSIADVIQYAVPTTGQTVAMANGATALIVNPAGGLLALTVTLPSSPIDGQRALICSTAAITILTVSGGTVNGGLSTLTLNGYERFIYSANMNAWTRTG